MPKRRKYKSAGYRNYGSMIAFSGRRTISGRFIRKRNKHRHRG